MSDRPVLVDTHIWLWMEDQYASRLSRGAQMLIESAARRGSLWISAMSVWEIAMLETKTRVELTSDVLTWVRASLAISGRQLIPLTPEIAVASTRLPDAPVGDPVDRILLATAITGNAVLLTLDQKLLDYGKRQNLNVVSA
jgi:PIN domain nuclease of toxin-antitoxin system